MRWPLVLVCGLLSARLCLAQGLNVGVAETDLTPPTGFPMAGYYHERLAEGTLDPLKARALVIRGTRGAAAWVVCDLIGISADLSQAIRTRAADATGIPADQIVVSATHSHTAPDYTRELLLFLDKRPQDPARATYIEKLIAAPAEAIVQAARSASPATLVAGSATQQAPVSFNRRFVMRDGSVRTWMNLQNPDVVRAAGPIDPEIGLIAVRNPDGTPRGIVSNFALHLDTVGGTRWSADYPHFIEQTLREKAGSGVVSLFGTGCCGDINHSDPSRRDRNKVDFIGSELGRTIAGQLESLAPVTASDVVVQTQTVKLPLQPVTAESVKKAVEVLAAAQRREKVEFLDHVTAYKNLMLDQLTNRPSMADPELLTWGRSRRWAGIGAELPVEVTVFALGRDVAIVFLPGEVFVDLGLAIKRASPFRTTLIVELSHSVETIYVPHRAAYAGGSYEVTNSTTQAGSGEMLVEAAVKLLRAAATTHSP